MVYTRALRMPRVDPRYRVVLGREMCMAVGFKPDTQLVIYVDTERKRIELREYEK